MKKWWGDIAFKTDEVKVWGIGDRKIFIQRKSNEWIVWNDTTSEENDKDILLETVSEEQFTSSLATQRYLTNNSDKVLKVMPALADRSVIVRPASPLVILPEMHATIYVSTPLWMKAQLLNSHEHIVDLPFWLPSDSWFGSNTMTGELCYAKYTDARITLDNISRRSHRAITEINVFNKHHLPLNVQRINLPAHYLRVYADKEKQLRTDNVNITHTESTDLPSLKIDSLEESTMFTKLCEPRVEADSNTLMRSIKSLVA